ncbi:hypothetical protein C8R43DRAFT_1134131 [Mycena crocata]|nr:hypothetical protein C8R43DRAFT_1134131 [Mycena crocata]
MYSSPFESLIFTLCIIGQIYELPRSSNSPVASVSTTLPTSIGPQDLSQGIPLTGDAARYAMLVAGSSGRTPALSNSSRRLFLNPVPHNPEQQWRRVASMPVENLAPWFEEQFNDFNILEMLPPQNTTPENLAVVVKWIGHPCDTPRDPRARRCFIRWNLDPRPPQSAIDHAVSKNLPVVRWDLRCAGAHEFDFDTLEEPEVKGGPVEIEDEAVGDEVVTYVTEVQIEKKEVDNY